MLEAVPDAATRAVPLSGGGLLAGIAVAVKARSPDVRVIGISMARGAAMKASLEAGTTRCWSRNCRHWRIRSAAASGWRTG